eukprot:NODE_4587_length_769_cov_74.137072_g4564_i0.p1 GENE.NODE_4587_length_769_cov_74.137072_g4564_i0~~NODE_4587_length_769_cov_74.137072_g4564_i0.p1  ORF type:complete len:249 (+),score=42.14 NODE_4587_length_769_cov_74.137072_g4564_i0:96-749(+)
MTVNHYQVLGVSENAADKQIKAAYKSLALKYHPDKNPSGSKQFQAVQAAYDVLSDASKRAEFDLAREAFRPPTTKVPFQGYGGGAAPMYTTRHVSVDDIIKQDRDLRKATGGKSVRELMKEAESQKREAEETRRKHTEMGQKQAAKVNVMLQRMRSMQVPGVVWKKDFEQFDQEEEYERRQIVAQQLAESDEEVSDELMFRLYVSASDVIIARRANY